MFVDRNTGVVAACLCLLMDTKGKSRFVRCGDADVYWMIACESTCVCGYACVYESVCRVLLSVCAC